MLKNQERSLTGEILGRRLIKAIEWKNKLCKIVSSKWMITKECWGKWALRVWEYNELIINTWLSGSMTGQLFILSRDCWYWRKGSTKKDVIQSLLKVYEKGLSLLNISATIFSSSLLAGNGIAQSGMMGSSGALLMCHTIPAPVSQIHTFPHVRGKESLLGLVTGIGFLLHKAEQQC